MSRESTGFLIGGKYRLIERIGDGGMGSIWRAVHQGLSREVAVKLVDLDGPNAEARAQRFIREAQTCAAVRHRFVVDIFDVDVTPSGHPYMVMELLHGETLANRMAREPVLSVLEMVDILARCLSGLDAVHRAGVVHRDLKPENIFLATEADGEVVPKIVDFGISMAAEAARIDSSARRLTREGTVLGTPWYMAPEQARAKSAVGPAADLYSVGVMAYEALTGQLPFDSESLTELLVMIVTENAEPLERWRPELPSALSDVVHRAMERDLGLRFSSALELRSALLAAVDGVPPSAPTILIPLETEDEVEGPPHSDDPFGRSSGVVRSITSDVAPHPAQPPPPLRSSSSHPPDSATMDSMDGVEVAAAPAPGGRPPSARRRGLLMAAGLGFVVTAALVAWLLSSPGGSPSSPSTAAPAAQATTTPSRSLDPAEGDVGSSAPAATGAAPAEAEGVPSDSSAPTVVDEGTAEAPTPPTSAASEEPTSSERRRARRRRARSSRRREPAAFRELDF